MTPEIEIRCIHKLDRQNPHERITHIGGKNPDGQHWLRTQAQAIQDIESKTYRYFVKAGGKLAWVVVAVSRYGYKYLKTEDDGEDQNNLLSLRECPI